MGGSRGLLDDSDRDEDMDSTFQAILTSNNLPNDFNNDIDQSRICRFVNENLVNLFFVAYLLNFKLKLHLVKLTKLEKMVQTIKKC